MTAMRVALFGGSFNPPHIGHQLVALTVLETCAVDQLWMIPCFRHRFDKALAPFLDRMEMCRRAMLALGDRAQVSDIEGQLGGESRTLVTVSALRAAHPGVEFQLVIGADLEAEVDTWYGAAELRRLISFIVVGRAGRSGGESGDPSLGPQMPAVSSTDVRARLGRSLPVNALVPRLVLDYIGERKLYGPSTT
jgi:nicotinate-nucleotide adenylyltransferase